MPVCIASIRGRVKCASGARVRNHLRFRHRGHVGPKPLLRKYCCINLCGGTAIVDRSGKVACLRSALDEFVDDFPITLAEDASGAILVGMSQVLES